MRDFAEQQRQVEESSAALREPTPWRSTFAPVLETIAAQRAYVDQVLERSSTLAFQMKQAEALMDALRSECALATKVRMAVDEMRDQSSATD